MFFCRTILDLNQEVKAFFEFDDTSITIMSIARLNIQNILVYR